MTGQAPATPRTGAGATVRRLIVFILMFAMVVIATTGLGGLLGRLLDLRSRIAVDDTTGLALSLAFALVAGPLAAVLWWYLWRSLGDAVERSSFGWGLYLAGMQTVSLLTLSTSLLATGAALLGGDWLPHEFASGVAWAGVWVWHEWMRRNPAKSPTRLVGVAIVIGSVYGLVVGIGGAVTSLGTLLDSALDLGEVISFGDPWWLATLKALVWAVGGAMIWWWHWIRRGGRALTTGFAEVALVLVTGLGAVILTLGGAATAIFVVLRLAFDPSDPPNSILDPLGQAVAAAAIGAIVLAYYLGITGRSPDPTRQANRLVVSGVGLVAVASGIGVVVNSLLAAITVPLAESGTRTLLLGGISAIVVGGPAWWAVWKPTKPVDPSRTPSTGRRVYLLSVFGISAVVALVTLLVIGFRIFEFTLDLVTGQSLVDRVRAPLGLLLATGLVAGYHFAVWRRDRASIATAPQRARTIGRVTLVAGPDSGPLADAIGEATGARVTTLRRTDLDDPGMTAEHLVGALNGVVAEHVLVVTGPDARIEVIPLER